MIQETGSLFASLPEQRKRLDTSLVPSDWRAPHPDTWPRFRDAKRIGVDTEFRDATLLTLGVGVRRDPSEYYMVGVSVAIEDGPKLYLPFAHDGGDNLDKAQVLGYLKDEFKGFNGDVVGANLPCDLDWLWEAGVAMPQVHRFYDVQVADPLLYELERSYRLDDIAKRRDFPGKTETLLKQAAQSFGLDTKKDLWRFPARYVGPYAEDDGWLPLKILRKQEHDIEEQGLSAVWDMESRLLPLLVRMSRKGVIVDMDRVDAMERWSNAAEQRAWDVVKRETGVCIPVGECMNVGLLTEALRAAGLDHCIGANSKGDGVTKEMLNAEKHPVAQAILEARKASVLRTTFIAGTRKHAIKHGDEWRIHCSFNQIRKTEEAGRDGADGETKGVAYGRLSASHPNMQNQPAADRLTGENRLGCMWRSVYKPERGTLWTACDLKQQEPKWSFHYGAMLEKITNKWGERAFPQVTGAVALCDRLNADPTLDTYEPLVELTGKKRPVCKIMWLARAYGKGNGNMSEELGFASEDWVFVPRKMKSVPVNSEDGARAMSMPGHVVFKGASPEGLKVIQDFDASMPFLKVSADLAKERADERGYVTLISGRRCHFEPNGKGGFEWTHKAFNRLIQGTAAEQTKQIMIAVDEAGYGDDLMLQVHDELDGCFETEVRGSAMAEVMRHAVPMLVPTVVDIERGPSWGESMSIEEVIDGKKTKRQYVWDVEV